MAKLGDGMMIMAIFIGVIIAATLIAQIGDDAAAVQITQLSAVNDTVTAPAANTSVAITGRELVGTDFAIHNTSSSVPLLNVKNYTISTQLVNGLSSVVLIGGNDSAFEGMDVNVSYTYIPDGTVSGGARSITGLVVIFAALAIVFFIIAYLFRGTLGELMRRM